ncbi:MAG: hypothetical protein ACO1OT_01050 [Heyndrickxia sp.]
MVLLWAAKCLTFGYGALTSVAGILQLRKRNIPIWSAFGMTIIGIVFMISAIFVNGSSKWLYVIFLCLILMHILSITNGIHLYRRINIIHHVIRLLFSLVIVLFYVV